jgi:iron complex transport system ATP-binding protein
MLRTTHLTYAIRGKKLLDDVSVSFSPGGLNLIIGPNGAGKTTLIKALCQQIKPESGAVFYGDTNAAQLSVASLARMRAVLSQNIELAFPLSVAEVVMMGRYPHFAGTPSAKDEATCEAAMRFFDVWEMADRNYTSLSGGEKQRTHFARVAAQIWNPATTGFRYLILDEPLTFLDVYYQFDFMHKLMELLQEKDLVVAGVVHDLNLAAKFANHIVLMHQGKILASGNREETLTAEHIRTAYRLEPVIRKEDGNLHLFF